MVLGDVASVLHGAPAGPRLDAVDRGVPNALTPNHILEVERAAVIHHPLSDLTAGRGRNLDGISICARFHSTTQTYTTAIRAHKVNCLATAVIRRAGAGTVPGAVDLPDAALPRGDDLLGALHGDRLAGADGGEGGGAVSAEARGARGAALHLGRARALVGDRGPRAVARPTAVARATVSAGRLGAALDVGGVGGAGPGDANAAGGRAVGGGDADAYRTSVMILMGWVWGRVTRSAAGPNAGLVDGGHGGRGR